MTDKQFLINLKPNLMKLTRIILTILMLIAVCHFVVGQSTSEKGTSINFQFSASTPFGLPANSASIIPQIGFDFNFGDFGVRAAGQFFKTSAEFDMNAYLNPINTFVTQSGNEKHSNITFGINPYANLPVGGFTLQPSLGVHYLSQNGADLMASYGTLAPGSILNATGGDNKRSAVVLAPSVRALFGDANKPLRFFAEAGYSMPVGIKEYKITSRNLDGVLLPDGGIDPDLMEMGTTISYTEKMFPPNFWIGIGLELGITSSRKGPTPDEMRTVQKRTHEKANKKESVKDEGDINDCCDQLFVNPFFDPDMPCCVRIEYKTRKGCLFNRVEVFSLNGKTFSVPSSITGLTESTEVNYFDLASTSPNGFPFGGLTDLLTICSSPNTQGPVDIDLTFYTLNGDTCIRHIIIDCPSAPQDECECDGWEEDGRFSISSTNTPVTQLACNGNYFSPNPGWYDITIPNYICYPDTCTTLYSWQVNGPVSGSDFGQAFSFNFNQAGVYHVIITPECGTQKCPPCTFTIVIGSSQSCECAGWMTEKPIVIQSTNGATVGSGYCDDVIVLAAIGSYTMTAPHYNCSPSDPTICHLGYSWEVTKNGNNIGTHNGSTYYFNFTSAGTYTITLTPHCGTLDCPPCKFEINIKEGECSCGEWSGKTILISNSGLRRMADITIQNQATNLDFKPSVNCGSIAYLPIRKYWFTAPTFGCIGNNCIATYIWTIHDPQGNLVATGSGYRFNYRFPRKISGDYQVTITPTCNNTKCDPCLFKVRIDKNIRKK